MVKRKLTAEEKIEYNKRYAEELAKWDERLRPEIEAIERSERLTAADYAVVINCRGECDDDQSQN